jgi:predicted RNA polymerase sigma factor
VNFLPLLQISPVHRRDLCAAGRSLAVITPRSPRRATCGSVTLRLTYPDAGRDYHLLPSVRGDLLFTLGRFDEARAEFERAAALKRNARERELLLERARACAGDSTPSEPQ